MADRPDDPPPYRVYRARPALLARLRRSRGDGGGGRLPPPGPRRPRLAGRRTAPGRVVLGLLVGVLLWLVLSGVVFLVSATLSSGLGADADEVLDGGGDGLTRPATVLLIGSDARSEETAEPGSRSGPDRADTLLLLRVGGGATKRLSIPRDTLAEIPGRGREKINAAYAFGGPALTIQAVEGLLGIGVDHAVEVDFERFPKLIDAMGGVTYRGGCVVSRINGGARNGGVTLRLRAGENHLDGRQALALARTRTNLCKPREDDRARARRQQKIVGAMRGRVLSPAGFARLPAIAWQAPRSLRSDMAGPTLMALALGVVTGGEASTRVLPVQVNPEGGTGLLVDGPAAERAVDRFLG